MCLHQGKKDHFAGDCCSLSSGDCCFFGDYCLCYSAATHIHYQTQVTRSNWTRSAFGIGLEVKDLSHSIRGWSMVPSKLYGTSGENWTAFHETSQRNRARVFDFSFSGQTRKDAFLPMALQGPLLTVNNYSKGLVSQHKLCCLVSW